MNMSHSININDYNMLAISKVNISMHYQYLRDIEERYCTRRADCPTVRGNGQNTDFLH